MNRIRTGGSGAERGGNRVTATEVIDGVIHLVVLERDASGRYREVSVTPIRSHDARPAG